LFINVITLESFDIFFAVAPDCRLLPPLGVTWDVMLVWRKGNIEKTVSVLQYCVLL